MAKNVVLKAAGRAKVQVCDATEVEQKILSPAPNTCFNTNRDEEHHFLKQENKFARKATLLKEGWFNYV